MVLRLSATCRVEILPKGIAYVEFDSAVLVSCSFPIANKKNGLAAEQARLKWFNSGSKLRQ